MIDCRKDFDDETLAKLEQHSDEELEKLLQKCKDESTLCDTNQISRKVLINSLYGA